MRRSNSAANSVTSGDDTEHGGRPARSVAGAGGTGTPIQSRSFRILQWMTGADQDDGE